MRPPSLTPPTLPRCVRMFAAGGRQRRHPQTSGCMPGRCAVDLARAPRRCAVCRPRSSWRLSILVSWLAPLASAGELQMASCRAASLFRTAYPADALLVGDGGSRGLAVRGPLLFTQHSYTLDRGEKSSAHRAVAYLSSCPSAWKTRPSVPSTSPRAPGRPSAGPIFHQTYGGFTIWRIRCSGMNQDATGFVLRCKYRP